MRFRDQGSLRERGLMVVEPAAEILPGPELFWGGEFDARDGAGGEKEGFEIGKGLAPGCLIFSVRGSVRLGHTS